MDAVATESPKSRPKPLNFKQIAKDFANGLFSKEPSVKPMSWLFLLSSLGLVTSLTVFFVHLGRDHKEEVVSHSKTAQKSELDDEENQKVSRTHHLGSFTVSLKSDDDQAKIERAAGVVNMIEFDAFMECDEDATCAWLTKHEEKMRDHLLRNLSLLYRDDALTKEGKKKLRESMIQILNSMLPKGEVKAIYFSKLIVG